MRTIAWLSVAWLVAAPAAAQDIVVTIQSMEGRTSVDLTDLATTSAVPVSQDECDANAVIDFRFTMVDMARAQLHLFHGSNCEMSSVRNDTTDTSCSDLNLEYSIDMNTEVNKQIPVSSLIDCTAGSSGTRTIYVLALDNETSEVTAAGQAVSFPIAFDFAGPSAPSMFAARDGESSVTLSWEATSDQVTQYDVFFVENGCDASGNVTTTLLDDPENPDLGSLLTTAEGTATSATVAFPSTVGAGTQHAIAIRAVDNAGNAGQLSSVVCVSQIDVQTFWDAYCGGGGGSADACASGCSVGPGRSSAPGLLSLLAGLAMLAWVFRRRLR